MQDTAKKKEIRNKPTQWAITRILCFRSLFFVKFGGCFSEFIVGQKFTLFLFDFQFSEIRSSNLQRFLYLKQNNIQV